MLLSKRQGYLALLAAVMVGGLATVVLLGNGWGAVKAHTAVVVVLSLLLLITEFVPITLLYRHSEVEVATSAAFTLALLLVTGVGPTITAQVAASIAADLVRRKGAVKMAYNAAQFAIAIVPASYILSDLGSGPVFRGGVLQPGKVAAYCGAAAAFFVVNNLLIWAVITLASDVSSGERLSMEWLPSSVGYLLLLGLAPVVDLVALRALPMLPLLLVPVGAIYLVTRLSVNEAHARDATAHAERERLQARSERDELERQLNQALRLESLGQLAGGVAHDFNNLLGVIMNFAAFAGEEVDAAGQTDEPRDWPAVRRDIAEIEKAAARAADLTSQLLAFARRQVINPQVLVLNDVVGELEQFLRRTIGEHVELVFSLGSDVWPVRADRGQLEQVLINLAVNARDSMKHGGRLTIRTSNKWVADQAGADPRAVPAGRFVELQVIDTGTGMTPDVVDRAFEPFFTTKPAGEGTGLGLATVYGIVTQCSGSVQIDSTPGSGTTFIVLLPATDAEVVEPPTPGQATAGGGGETILVVEDESGTRDVTERILMRGGYHVLSACDGQEALEMLHEHGSRIDLILTDVVMPRLSGLDLAKRVLELFPSMPVMLMSGYAEPFFGGNAPVGTEVPLDKPFSEETLLERVRARLVSTPAADLSQHAD